LKEKEYLKYLDKFDNERVRIRIKTEKGGVLDIVVQYETKIKEQWNAVVRYDCAHGFFHRDVIFPNGNKEKHTIAITDLEAALTYAEQDIKDRWEFYRERYLKLIKK